MGFKTKVQLIKRQNSEQWYINFPSALAQAWNFPGAKCGMVVSDKKYLILTRPKRPGIRSRLKKTALPPRRDHK